MSPGPRSDDVIGADVLRGLAARLNDTLAVLLLNVDYLRELLEERGRAPAQASTPSGAVIDETLAAIARIREVVRDLEALAGDEPGDAAETFSAVLRLVAPSMPHAQMIERPRGPAPTAVPRRRLAAISALAVGEVRRALADCRVVVATSCERADLEVVLGLRADVADGGRHQLDGEHATWHELRALLAAFGGRLAIDRADASFAIEIRLPATGG